MNRKKAWILIGLYTLITIADCGITRYATPNLRLEANPLVALLGYGWPALILANVISLIIYSVLVYYSFGVYKTPVIRAANEQELKNQLKKEGKGHIFAMFGYSFGYSMIFARLLVVFNWLIRIFDLNGHILKKYKSFRYLIPSGRVDLLLVAVLTAVFCVIWMIKEEKRKKANAVIIPPETPEEATL